MNLSLAILRRISIGWPIYLAAPAQSLFSFLQCWIRPLCVCSLYRPIFSLAPLHVSLRHLTASSRSLLLLRSFLILFPFPLPLPFSFSLIHLIAGSAHSRYHRLNVHGRSFARTVHSLTHLFRLDGSSGLRLRLRIPLDWIGFLPSLGIEIGLALHRTRTRIHIGLELEPT